MVYLYVYYLLPLIIVALYTSGSSGLFILYGLIGFVQYSVYAWLYIGGRRKIAVEKRLRVVEAEKELLEMQSV